MPASISCRDGRSNARSIRPGTSAFSSGSSASRLLWSYHSYSRVVLSTGASGFVQVISRWKIGKCWNMPPGAVVAREHGMRDAERAAASSSSAGRRDRCRRRPRRSRPAGTAGLLPPLDSALRRGVPPSQQPEHELRPLEQQALELGGRNHEAAQHVSSRRRRPLGGLARQRRRSRRRSRRGSSACRSSSLDLDRGLAVEDDEEVRRRSGRAAARARPRRRRPPRECGRSPRSARASGRRRAPAGRDVSAMLMRDLSHTALGPCRCG